jgi:uncharacterized membrane protein
MSDANRILIFATFDDRAMADYVNTSIRDNAAEAGVTVEALALIEKDHEGRVHTQEKGDTSAKEGAIKGGIAGAIFGLIFPPSIIASAIVGGTIAAVAAKLRESGFPSDELRKIGERMQNGEFAVLFLGRESAREFVHRYLADAKMVSEQVLPGSLSDVINV